VSLSLLFPQGGTPPPPATVPTGDARFPATDVYPDPNLYPSQGLYPIPRLLYSTDAVSVTNPNWTDTTTDLRAYSTTRGRGSENEEFDAGTATFVLDDRDRQFDPNVNASIRPFNRWWLLIEFAGEVHDLFKGYAQAYNEDWDESGIVDAATTVTCADEFIVLASVGLPTTDPVRESYSDLIASDNPIAYYNLNEDPTQIAAFEPTPPPPADESAEDEKALKPLKKAKRKAVPSTHRKRFG